jgi:hypothetical protein
MDIDKLLIVDIKSVPAGLDPDVWINLITERNICLWASEQEGNKPECKTDNYRIVDISTLSNDERNELNKLLDL